MVKITVEIDDVLPECFERAVEETQDLLKSYLNDYQPDGTPVISDLDDFHSVIDSNVPIMTREIEGAWYLHGSELRQAYEDAGIGENPLENNGKTAIFLWIEQKVCEWYDDNADEIFEEWEHNNNNQKET